MNIYSMYDNMAKKCAPLWESDNDATAIRAFANSMKQRIEKSHDLYADDHDLYCFGSIAPKEEMQIIVANDNPRLVITGKAVMEKIKNDVDRSFVDAKKVFNATEVKGNGK